MNVKKSKRQRKFVNAMRGMADVPTPARRFRYPPTFAPHPIGARCPRILAVTHHRRRGWRWLVDLVRRRKPRRVAHVCGGKLVLVPFDGRRRGHVACSRCAPAARNLRRRGGLARVMQALDEASGSRQ